MDWIKSTLFGSTIRRGTTILTTLTFVSYALGLVRDVLFAHVLGASRVLDVYNAAFIIPDALLSIFVASALAAAFIPVFTGLRTTGRESEAEHLAATTLASAPIMVAGIGVIAWIFMPQLAHFVAPGFSSGDLELFVRMSRLMLLSPILFAISNTLGSILVSLERFTSYGLSAVLYNAGIIGGIFLVPYFGPMGLVVGMLAGAVLHLVARLIGVLRSSFRPHGPIKISDPHFREVLRLMVPRIAGQPIEQITFFIFTRFASVLAVGSVAILNFARNFQAVPVSMFGISLATATFPALSRAAARKDHAGFSRALREASIPLIIVSVISMLVYMIFGKFIIGIFLGSGQFSDANVRTTALLLSAFAISIPAESFIHLLVRAFYALRDTWTPVLISVPGLGLIWLITYILLPFTGIQAIGISYAISMIVEVLILWWLLSHKIARLGTD